MLLSRCKTIHTDGAQCNNSTVAYSEYCHWHKLANFLPKGKVRNSDFWNSFKLGLVIGFIIAIGSSTWNWLRIPSWAGFLFILLNLSVAMLLIGLINSSSANCKVFWPKLLTISCGVVGMLFIITAYIYYSSFDIYKEMMVLFKLSSLPPRNFFAISTGLFGLGFLSLFFSLAFLNRIASLLGLLFFSGGCLSIFMLFIFHKNPLWNLIISGIILIIGTNYFFGWIKKFFK